MLTSQQITATLEPYLGGHVLAPAQIDQIVAYTELLLKWNRVMSLSAIRGPDQILRRHFGESLFAARHLLTPAAACEVIDVGSGAGFPGIVLKIFAPFIRLRLIESQGKKATFLKEVARTLNFPDMQVARLRAESFVGQAELVTFRAVESFEVILRTAGSLVAPGGTLGALIGHSQFPLATSHWRGRWRMLPIPESDSRVLAIWNEASR